MANSAYKGIHFGESDGTINFFGLKGCQTGKNWAIDIAFLGPEYTMVEVARDGISQKIENVIRLDTEAGREEAIDHVLISSRYATILWLEGRLNRTHLENAEEDKDSITLFNVLLGGKPRKVIVKDERVMEHHCATIDANGDVV